MNGLLQQNISIGPLNLPLVFVSLLLAWILYRFVMKKIYRNRAAELSLIERTLSTGILIIVVVWKLSPVLFQFSTVISNPIAVLYLPGGTAGFLIGIAAAIVYSAVIIKRQKEARMRLVKSLLLGFAVIAVLFAAVTGALVLFTNLREPQADDAKLIAGNPAPDFSLEAIDGSEYSLSDYRGRTLVVNFWASWCPPCKAELPELVDFYSESASASDNLDFISINLYTTEREPGKLPEFIESEAIPYPVLLDRSGKTAADYGISSIPTTVIITPEGDISSVKLGAVTKVWLNAGTD